MRIAAEAFLPVFIAEYDKRILVLHPAFVGGEGAPRAGSMPSSGKVIAAD